MTQPVDPRSVDCPLCDAPAWTECQTYDHIARVFVPYGHDHLDRAKAAELAAETSLRLFPLWYNDR